MNRLGYVVLCDGVPMRFYEGTLWIGTAVPTYHDMRKVTMGGTLFRRLDVARVAVDATYNRWIADGWSSERINEMKLEIALLVDEAGGE